MPFSSMYSADLVTLVNSTMKQTDLAQKFQNAGDTLEQCRKKVKAEIDSTGVGSYEPCLQEFFVHHYPETFGIANNLFRTEPEAEAAAVIKNMVYTPENCVKIHARLAHLASNALSATEPFFTAQNNPDASGEELIKAAFTGSRTFFSSENEEKIRPIIDELTSTQMSYAEWLMFDRHGIVKECFFSKSNPIDLNDIQLKLKIYRDKLEEDQNLQSFMIRLAEDTEITSALGALLSIRSDEISFGFRAAATIMPTTSQLVAQQILLMADDIDSALSAANHYVKENEIRTVPQSAKEEAEIKKENLFVLGRALSDEKVENHILSIIQKWKSLINTIQEEKQQNLLNQQNPF